MDRIKSLIRRTPFTLLMLAAIVVGALVTNTHFQSISHHWLGRLGFAPNDLWYWRLERLFTSALVTEGGKVFWEALLLVAFFVGLAELLMGSKRTALTFWGVHLLVLVLTSFIISYSLHQLRSIGVEVSEAARDVGPSAGYFACLGLISARQKPPWHWVSGGFLFAFFIIALLKPAAVNTHTERQFSANLAHALAFPLGWLSGTVGEKVR